MANILLVDDDDVLRRVLESVLTRAGHQVRQARNGREALELYRESAAELVITDLVMPEKEGIETISALRQMNSTLPIIAISGAGDSWATVYLKIARHMGAQRVLAKPFDATTIVEAVECVLAAA